MKPTDLIKTLPTGSPAGEILKIAALIAATILVDKIGNVVTEITNENKPPQIIYKEEN
ncbi:MAG: hypothetical protein J6B01_12545 [Ruminococcus sp.]|nr:hypothetical protein [Ruminococcus sp.]